MEKKSSFNVTAMQKYPTDNWSNVVFGDNMMIAQMNQNMQLMMSQSLYNLIQLFKKLNKALLESKLFL
jgi:hypothetical protein